MLDKFLNLSQRNSKLQNPQILSLCDILIGDIGRILSGRLKFDEVNFIKHFLFGVQANVIFFKNCWSYSQHAEKGKMDILIQATEMNHLTQLVPVYHELKKHARVAFVTTNFKLADQLISSGLPLAIGGLNLRFSLKFSFLPISKELATFSKEGFDTRLIYKYLKSCLSNIRAQKLIYDTTLKFYDPKSLVVGNDLTFEGRMLVRMANSLNLKTYSIQHGFIAKDWLQGFHIAKTLFLYGQISKTRLDIQLRSNVNTVVAGAPYLDAFSADVIESSEELKSALTSLKVKKGYFLVCLSGYGHVTSLNHYNRILEVLESQIAASPDHTYVIKLHPKELISDYQRYDFHRFENVKFILPNSDLNRDTSIFTWISGSKCLITGNSATLYEAILMDRPVISIDLAQEYPDEKVSDYKAILYAKSKEEFESIFAANLFEDEILRMNMKRLSQDYFYAERNSCAAERISIYILKSQE
jgi:hypothetical protein